MCTYKEKKRIFPAFIIVVIIIYYFFSCAWGTYNTREWSIINSQLYGTMGKTDLSCAYYNNIFDAFYMYMPNHDDDDDDWEWIILVGSNASVRCVKRGSRVYIRTI